MEAQIKDYISWYKDTRNKFCAEVYVDKSTFLKRYLLPYSNWDSDMVLIKESELALEAMSKLTKLTLSKNMISLAALTLSNRIEYISDQSDFYVSYAALLIFTLTIINASTPLVLQILFLLVISCGVLFCLKNRLNLRQEVAANKELVNIFNHYESRHGK